MNKVTILTLKPEDLEKHTTSKLLAKKVYNLISCVDLESMSITDLLRIPGMGRRDALLIMKTVCDLMDKK